MQVRHLPNRDRHRSGVTTLKCASAHAPRFLTGSDASNKPSATPLRGQSSRCFYRAQAGRGPATVF